MEQIDWTCPVCGVSESFGRFNEARDHHLFEEWYRIPCEECSLSFHEWLHRRCLQTQEAAPRALESVYRDCLDYVKGAVKWGYGGV